MASSRGWQAGWERWRGVRRPAARQLAKVRDPVAESRLFGRRAVIALALALAALLTLVGRLIYLQVVNHTHYTTLSENNRVKLQPLPPTRGLIYDRNGVLLADNLTSRRLEITPEQVQDLAATLTWIQARIEVTEADLERFHQLRQRQPPYQSTPLRLRLTDAEVARLAIDLHRYPGVDVRAYLTRAYPLGPLAAHVIGYVGRIDEEDLQRIDTRQYRGSTHIGKIGVEQAYETMLHGQVGYQQVETNAQGRNLRVLKSIPPTPGKNIYLSLDVRLQRVAEQALADHNGAVVALDPRNGEVLALVSTPTYDPNPFVNGIDYESYRALNTSPDRPLFNRALRGVYPPGSTIKPLVGLAGLELNVFSARKRVYCPGFYRLPGNTHRFRDWRRSGHGSMALNGAIAQSCDVYFYDLAFHLGIDRLHDYLARFGLGQLTGIDLRGEKAGLLPSRAWKRARHDQGWFPGETLIAGIGQGYMLTTPLQLAHATAILAQHGQGFQPRLLYATQEQGGAGLKPQPPRPAAPIIPVDPRYWRWVHAAMIDVVHGRRGTARKIGEDAGFTIAGKTGTAQVFSLGQDERYDASQLAKHLHDHALFVAFAPAEAPRIALAVVVEHGGGGSTTAAPIARKVLDAHLQAHSAAR